jgi:hypothetical protein
VTDVFIEIEAFEHSRSTIEAGYALLQPATPGSTDVLKTHFSFDERSLPIVATLTVHGLPPEDLDFTFSLGWQRFLIVHFRLTKVILM